MKRRTNGLLRWVSKFKWIILLIVAIFPFALNSIIAQQIWPYWNVAGDANAWIGFWGAYAGAIGTVFMAIIAVKALEVNAEQLEIIKQQNRPYLFCSVSIFHHYDPDLECNKETYILRIENHGIQIAKQVKVKIGFSDVGLLADPLFKKNVKAIEAASFSLPAKGEKNFILYNAIPNSPQGESNEEKREDWEYQWKYIEQLKNSVMSVTLSCEGYGDEHETIAMNSVGYLPTTTVQILDRINRSIKQLSCEINNNK